MKVCVCALLFSLWFIIGGNGMQCNGMQCNVMKCNGRLFIFILLIVFLIEWNESENTSLTLNYTRRHGVWKNVNVCSSISRLSGIELINRTKSSKMRKQIIGMEWLLSYFVFESLFVIKVFWQGNLKSCQFINRYSYYNKEKLRTTTTTCLSNL